MTEYRVEHLEKVDGSDGSYKIDATLRFELLGMEFFVLMECKHHNRPVEREDLMVLNDKLRSTQAHKGVFFSTSGDQQGALTYARKNKMALVRLVNGALAYETKSGLASRTNRGVPKWLQVYANTIDAYEIYFAPTVYAHKILTDQPAYALGFLIHGLPGIDTYADGTFYRLGSHP